jgi:hypothetical protein
MIFYASRSPATRLSITASWTVVVSTVSFGHAAAIISFALVEAANRSFNGVFEHQSV